MGLTVNRPPGDLALGDGVEADAAHAGLVARRARRQLLVTFVFAQATAMAGRNVAEGRGRRRGSGLGVGLVALELLRRGSGSSSFVVSCIVAVRCGASALAAGDGGRRGGRLLRHMGMAASRGVVVGRGANSARRPETCELEALVYSGMRC